MILLITDSFLKLQKVNQDDYFLPQIDVLNSEKIHDFEIIWSEDKPVAEAAEDIKEKILRSPTPVTIIAHGKGGLDAIECLIQNPELQEKVELLTTMQTPLWGTPVADFLTGHPIASLFTMAACKFMGCSMKAIEEMSELNRQVYMIINKEKLRNLITNVNVVTVGTTFDMPLSSENFVEKVLKRLQKLVTSYAGANDGLVPLISTRISNEPHVQLENMTHFSSVTPSLSVVSEIEDVTRNILRSIKTAKPSERPSKSLSGQSAARTGLKPVRPFQLEIS